MRLVTYTADGTGERLGASVDDDSHVVDLAAADPVGTAFTSMQALIDGGAGALDRARAAVNDHPSSARLPAGSVRMLPPLRPKRILGAPLMDPEKHLRRAVAQLAVRMAEVRGDVETHHRALDATLDRLLSIGDLEVESRDHLSLSGPEDVVRPPGYAGELDYEIELGCVIGRTGRDVTPEAAPAYVFGYTVFNDWSARDQQARNMLSGIGFGGNAKDFDGGSGIGPCIVTRDEIEPYALTMTARVNGQEWSRGSSAEHIATFEDAIVRRSRGRTIHAGELWVSGTVGTGCGLELGRTLPDGAVVEVEIEKIGVLRNRVVIP